jgi:Capsule polysaccharide biosynthesis protein
MRFLFATLQYAETDFYARVGRELVNRGHDVAHLTYSRRAASLLRRRGDEAYCLPELMDALPMSRSWREEEARIVAGYPISNLADVYGTDPHCRRRDGAGCPQWTVRQFAAVEDLFERVRPEVVVPEVGNEAMRTIAHLVGSARGATTLFLMYTLFDDPLRLYAGTMDAPVVDAGELRPLSLEEEAELDQFIARYRRRNEPIREYREVAVGGVRPRAAARHVAVKALWDRDNVYLTPTAWFARDLRARARIPLARRLYSPGLPGSDFLYFPLQVADDYKLIRLRPECADQEAIVERIVEALPPGVDLVVKEHPMSIGRNSVRMLRRIASHSRVHLVEPRTSTLELIERSAGVVTISSTVGLEALMCGRPVMTLGRPFYSGYGTTLDTDWPGPLSDALRRVRDFRPDRALVRRFMHAAKRRCYPGAPVLVDDSDENALRLATTLDRTACGDLNVARPRAHPG